MAPFGLFGPPDVWRLKAKRDVAGLIRATSYKKDAGIAEAAINALGELGNPQAIEPLFAILRDQCWSPERHRSAAFKALAKIQNAPIELLIAPLSDRNGAVRRAALNMLRQVTNPRAVPQLISLLGNSEASGDAAKALAKIGAPAFEPLITALASRAASPRGAAARALGWLGDRRAVSSLIAALRDPDEHVVSAAAEALGQLGDPQAVEPLIATLARHELDRFTRGAVAKAMGEIRDPRAVDALVTTLRDEERWVQDHAGRALVEIGQPAVEPLIAILNEVQGTPRVAAAKSLAQLYQLDKLSESCKQQILAVRGTLASVHHDASAGECAVHFDVGVKDDLAFHCS